MKLNVALTRFNQEFIQLLNAVTETNGTKLHFNDGQYELNTEILENGPSGVNLTSDPEEFRSLIATLMEQVSANTELLEEGFEASNLNQEKFAGIRENLDAELAAIDEHWDKIEAQQLLAAELLGRE